MKVNLTIKPVDSRLCTGKPLLSPCSVKQIKQMGVTQVIDLRASEFWKRLCERVCCRLFGIKYINYKVPAQSDEIPSAAVFDKINNSITSNNGVTYLHCRLGAHRTGMCVAVYEKKVLKKGIPEVCASFANRFFEGMVNNSNSLKGRLSSVYNKFLENFILNN